MDMERREILSLVAAGRITAAEAERLLAAWNESRETAWIVALCLAFACIWQLHLGEMLPALAHFCSVQASTLATALRHAVSAFTSFGGGQI